MSRRGLYVGTSGWTYDDWDGLFYPADVRGAERLSYYAESFNTVEVNASFYRTPTAPMINAWNKRLGKEFHLVLKGPRTVTHLKKLAECDEALGFFLERAMQLKRLRVILWQLPPSLHKDTSRLDGFLEKLPKDVRHAVEFRHQSWWDDEVKDVLAKHRASFVAVSHPEMPDDVIPTTDFMYVRFHGLKGELYTYDYPDEELARWAGRLAPHLKGRALYAFFNNDYNAHAVKNAFSFRKILAGMALKKAV